MRSSSLTTTILNENPCNSDYLSELMKENDNQNEDRSCSPVPTDKLVFKTSKLNPKSSFWTVTDRQAEWYKLTIPVNQSSTTSTNSSALITPSRSLSTVFERKKSSSNLHEQNEELTDTTQLMMKVVMQELDYDMDQDDFDFLQELNEYMKTSHQRLLTEEDFENAIIMLEYNTAEKIRSHLKQKSCDDDDIVCDICLLPDADDGNEMVFCERCNACVHQNCYGISVVPNGTWLCKPCSIVRRPACLLCPKFGGPMKCTPSGTVWCHLTCAFWLPELKFGDYVKMEPILNLDRIPHARWTLRCVVCSTSEGACVQCAHKNCRTPFHVTCGLSAGYFLDVQQTSSDGTNSSRSQFNAYCLKHSNEARKRAEPDSSFHDENSPVIHLTVYHRQQLKHDQWIHQSYEHFHTFLSSFHLHEQTPQDYNETLSEKIYFYWKNKRIQNKNLPLIKRIEYVLEQRENAELLIAQINNCLKIRNKLRQLQNYCKTILSTPSSALNQRFDHINNLFKSSFEPQRKPLYEYYAEIIEKSQQCIVGLETTYRDGLELNTTYVVGKSLTGETMLLPKQLLNQVDVITIDQQAPTPVQHLVKINESVSISDILKTPYLSQGNVVRCVTGSFD